MFIYGALGFGIVIGYVTYRTLRRSTSSGLADIATVIGAVGGAAVTALFPTSSDGFGAYGVGLAVGFFIYLLVSLAIAARTNGLSTVNEFLGEGPAGGANTSSSNSSTDLPPIPRRG